MRMAKIEFLYFDLGNVILPFNHEIAYTRIAAKYDVPSSAVSEWVFNSGLQRAFENGEVDRETFCDRLSELSGVNLDHDFLLNAISDIFSLNRRLIPLISQLRAVNFPMGILSNTCIAHWEFALARFPALGQLFSQYVLSYEIGSMKPAALIYERAIAIADVEPSRCFFVDDRMENVEGALAAGWDAVLYQSVEQLTCELRIRGMEFNY